MSNPSGIAAPEYRGASRERLEELHAALLEALLEEFNKPEPPSAMVMLCVRKFLKDNGIVTNAAAAADLRTSLEQLRSLSLPFVNTDKETKK
jgi:hypothetical protein